MDRPQRIGTWVSGLAHGTVLLWAAFGGVLFRPQATAPVETTEVATMSEADFQAMAALARGRGPLAPEATRPSTCTSPSRHCPRRWPGSSGSWGSSCSGGPVVG